MNVDFTNRSKCDENNYNLGHTKIVTPFSVAEIQVCVLSTIKHLGNSTVGLYDVFKISLPCYVICSWHRIKKL